MAVTDVRFVGDPVAIVVADSRALAEDAAELVDVDYDILPALADYEAAIDELDQLVHRERQTNVSSQAASAPDPDLEAVFASAAFVVEETFHQQRYVPVPMECRGLVGARRQRVTGSLEVWLSTQNPHEARSVLSRVTGVPEQLVRVVGGDVGGGFGQKAFISRDEVTVVAAAHKLGITLKWIEDRQENLVAASHARVDRATVRMALDADARILAAHVDHLEDSGAYPVGGGTGAAGGRVVGLFAGPYRIPRFGSRTRAAWTNTSGRGAYRGPWMMETTAREQMLDVAARAAGIDPLELRRRNIVSRDELPFTSATGVTIDAVTPRETLEQAAEAIAYDDFREGQAAALRDGRLLGIGISCYVEPTSMAFAAFGVEAATVRVLPSGQVQAMFGTGAHGQGIETTMAQVVAEHLGVHVDDVTVLQGDTASAPFGGGTAGSRTAVIAGGAARAAALEVRDKVVAIASHLMEAAPEDLDVVDGVVSVRGTPARAMPLAQVAATAYHQWERLPQGLGPGLESVARYIPPPTTWSNACHICTVEVDPAYGTVQLLRYVVSEDCGVMINPMIVDGQIAGGVVQGIGGALLEHLPYDEAGNPTATTFMDYLLPTAADVPHIECLHIQTPSHTPGGSKGTGEGGAIGAPAAVFNAVADALALRGARVTRHPLDPPSIIAALAESELQA